MADKNEGLRSDGMKELLKDLSSPEGEKASEDDVKIYEPKPAAQDDPDDDINIFVTDYTKQKPAEPRHTIKVDDIIDVLSGKDIAEPSENTPDQPQDIDISDIPDTIFNHLSNEGDESENTQLGSHFTDSGDEDAFIPAEAEDEAEEEEEKNPKLKKFGRIMQKLSLIPKAVIYIIVVALISAYLSYFIISVGNDVFALVTDEGTVVITIPENATHDDVAKILKDNGVIEYAWVYKLYMKYRGSGDESSVYVPGDCTLKYEYNYSQIITALTAKSGERNIVRLTIPEGYTVDQMIDLFVSNGIGNREGFIEAINNYPFKHEFVRELDANGYPETRKYRLEGYLYPDTYDFYTDSSEVAVINKMLNAFNEKFYMIFIRANGNGATYKDQMQKKYGMSLDDIVILASMVQSEGGNASDFEYISYVFHNRLSHKSTFPKLESDATIQYILPQRETDSSQINISVDSPYNTYLYNGLPPGAISSPGFEALSAAMFPAPPMNKNNKEIDAYFFVSNNAGKTYYASTKSGHESNVAQVKKDNQAIEEGKYEG